MVREKRGLPGLFPGWFFLIFILSLYGCSSAPLRVVQLSQDLPKDLPSEMKNKFEIKEVASADKDKNNPSSGSKLDKNKKRSHRRHHRYHHSHSEIKNMAESEHPEEKQSKHLHVPRKSRVIASSKSLMPHSHKPAHFTVPLRRPAKEPLWIGERLVFGISYFGISAGDFSLEILPFKTMDQRKVYHIQGNAVSSSVFSLFYRINDVVETYIDYDGIFSHRFHVVLDETKQTRDSLELYDSEKGQTFYWNRWRRVNAPYVETKQYSPVPAFAQDSLSAMYFLRTVPLPQDAVVTFPVISEGKSWDAVCTVIRREKLSTPLGKVQTIVIRLDTKYQDILKKSGDSFLWLTDDDRRIPVRLEAKVRIGVVVASLKELNPGTPP